MLNLLLSSLLFIFMSVSTVEANQYNEDEAIIMNVSMYTPYDEGVGELTASGKRVRKGHVAMGWKYPFGTRIYIEGLGEFTVEDRGGTITNNHVDVYTDSYDEAIQFGRRNLKVWIIK